MNRLLVLTRELPYPPNAGDRIVTYGFIRALARRGHELHVLSYARDGDDPDAAALRSVCASVTRVRKPASALPTSVQKLRRAATGRSHVMGMFHSPAFRDAAAERIRELAPDVVLAQHPYMGQFFLDEPVAAALEATRARPVTNAHVVEYVAHRRRYRHASGLRSRAALAVEIPRLRRDELAVYDRSARTLVLGREDRAALEGRISSDVCHQRVGLDVDAYEPATAPAAHRLVFFGSYDWFPNADGVRWLCERIFPAVRAAHGSAELVVAGRGATDAITTYGDRPGITFAGEVDDLAALVRSATVMVAPLRIGGGTRIKLLESMAWGVPIVTTPAGVEGVDAAPGEDLVVARDREAVASAVAALLERPAERRRLARNARETVEERYSLDAIGPSLAAHLGVE